jgi:hypothetical protein
MYIWSSEETKLKNVLMLNKQISWIVYNLGSVIENIITIMILSSYYRSLRKYRFFKSHYTQGPQFHYSATCFSVYFNMLCFFILLCILTVYFIFGHVRQALAQIGSGWVKETTEATLLLFFIFFCLCTQWLQRAVPRARWTSHFGDAASPILVHAPGWKLTCCINAVWLHLQLHRGSIFLPPSFLN